MIKIVYFGTHDNAAVILKALATNQGFEIITVITQPDRPVGRKQILEPSPVKIAATELHLPVLQPETLKNFSPPAADLYIVCAYGVIISKRILAIPKHGALNIHYSLLPKYRGAAPFQAALLNGETETGITIMLLDELMDHGPILAQKKVVIDPHDTSLTLCEKLNEAAIPVLITTIQDWVDKKISPQIQDHTQATYASMLDRNDGKIDWNLPVDTIYNRYRAFTPWPGIWTTWEGKRLKLLEVSPAISADALLPGTVAAPNNTLTVFCGTGALEIHQLQLEGKKPTKAADFVVGHSNFIGARLGL